jgi:uncharacterized FlgJ-related protein
MLDLTGAEHGSEKTECTFSYQRSKKQFKKTKKLILKKTLNTMKKTILLTALMFMFIGWKRKPETPNLNTANLWSVIQMLDIKYPDLVYAQALLESGHFSSKHCKVNNNLFGMKFPRFRKTLAIGKGSGGYAIYKNWIASVKDYAIFQDNLFKKKEMNKKQFTQFLDHKYCESTGYVAKLTKIINKSSTVFNSSNKLKPEDIYEIQENQNL